MNQIGTLNDASCHLGSQERQPLDLLFTDEHETNNDVNLSKENNYDDLEWTGIASESHFEDIEHDALHLSDSLPSISETNQEKSQEI